MQLGATTLATTALAALVGTPLAQAPRVCYPTSASVTRTDGTTSATITRSSTSATVGPTFP